MTDKNLRSWWNFARQESILRGIFYFLQSSSGTMRKGQAAKPWAKRNEGFFWPHALTVQDLDGSRRKVELQAVYQEFNTSNSVFSYLRYSTRLCMSALKHWSILAEKKSCFSTDSNSVLSKQTTVADLSMPLINASSWNAKVDFIQCQLYSVNDSGKQ